jgi:hypothetical protein
MVLSLAAACADPGVQEPANLPAAAGIPSYVGRVWLSTDTSAAPGTLRTFLADGTLVMTSCTETYRLARWTSLSDGRVSWDEDGTRIDADVAQAKPDGLVLRLHLVREVREEHYKLASVPYVCPDVRPSP